MLHRVSRLSRRVVLTVFLASGLYSLTGGLAYAGPGGVPTYSIQIVHESPASRDLFSPTDGGYEGTETSEYGLPVINNAGWVAFTTRTITVDNGGLEAGRQTRLYANDRIVTSTDVRDLNVPRNRAPVPIFGPVCLNDGFQIAFTGREGYPYERDDLAIVWVVGLSIGPFGSLGPSAFNPVWLSGVGVVLPGSCLAFNNTPALVYSLGDVSPRRGPISKLAYVSGSASEPTGLIAADSSGWFRPDVFTFGPSAMTWQQTTDGNNQYQFSLNNRGLTAFRGDFGGTTPSLYTSRTNGLDISPMLTRRVIVGVGGVTALGVGAAMNDEETLAFQGTVAGQTGVFRLPAGVTAPALCLGAVATTAPNFTGFGEIVSLNNGGDVALIGIRDYKWSGLYVSPGAGGGLRTILRRGDPLSSKDLFGRVISLDISNKCINEAGQVVFRYVRGNEAGNDIRVGIAVATPVP